MQGKSEVAGFAITMLAAIVTVAAITGSFGLGFALGVGCGLMLALLIGAVIS